MIAKGPLTLDGDLGFLEQQDFNDSPSGKMLCRATDLSFDDKPPIHTHIPGNNLCSPIIAPGAEMRTRMGIATMHTKDGCGV